MNLVSKKIADFFSENDLVLSSYFSFAWTTNWIWNFSRIIKIKQKLNKKLFVWINKINTKEIIFNKIKIFDCTINDFILIDFNKIIKKDSELKNYLNKISQKYNFWFEINILSEIPRWYTLGFSWTLSSLLISGIYLFLEKIDSDLFEKDIITNKELFEEIRKISFDLEYLIKNQNTSGEASFMSFINSKNPIFYDLWESKNDYQAYELLNINNFPLNYKLVFSWLKVDSDRIEKNIQNNKFKIDEIQKYLLENFRYSSDSYLQNLLKNSQTYESLNNILVILNSFSLYYLDKIINFEQEEDIKWFLENINKIRYSLKIFEEHIDFAENFYSNFINLKKYKNSNIWITSGTSETNWWTFIIFYEDKESITIENILKKMKWDYNDLNVLYDSKHPLDNTKKFWINIEQFLTKKIIWEFSNKKWVLLKDEKISKIIDYKNLENLKYDILIDTIKNKLYISWEKLSSNDIHSQTIAVEILSKLLKSEKSEIDNNEISYWSYRNNKIEINWKLIIPFKKVILEKLNYIFPIEIKWTIWDYKISLWENKLNIWIIEKI